MLASAVTTRRHLARLYVRLGRQLALERWRTRQRSRR